MESATSIFLSLGRFRFFRGRITFLAPLQICKLDSVASWCSVVLYCPLKGAPVTETYGQSNQDWERRVEADAFFRDTDYIRLGENDTRGQSLPAVLHRTFGRT